LLAFRRGPTRSCRTTLPAVKHAAVPADTAYVDAAGARHLAARIRAGVRVGNRIELLSTAGEGGQLAVGDCGVVESIGEDGRLLVAWDRGFARPIDPVHHRYRLLAV